MLAVIDSLHDANSPETVHENVSIVMLPGVPGGPKRAHLCLTASDGQRKIWVYSPALPDHLHDYSPHDPIIADRIAELRALAEQTLTHPQDGPQAGADID